MQAAEKGKFFAAQSGLYSTIGLAVFRGAFSLVRNECAAGLQLQLRLQIFLCHFVSASSLQQMQLIVVKQLKGTPV